MRHTSYDYEYPKTPPQLRRPAPIVVPAKAGIQGRGAARGRLRLSVIPVHSPSVVPAKAGIQGRGAGRGRALTTANRRATPIAHPTAGAIRKSPAPKPVSVRPEPVEGPPHTLTPPPCPDAPTDATVPSW